MNKRYHPMALAIMAGLLASAATGAQAAYVFNHSLAIPGGNNVNNYIFSVNGINAGGSLVGTTTDYLNTGNVSGFVDNTSVAYDPGNGGSNSNEIRAINAQGHLAGNYYVNGGISSAGFYSTGAGTSTPTATLSDPNAHGGFSAVQTWAYGLNDNGIVVGYDQLSNGAYYSYTYNTATHAYTDLSGDPSAVGNSTRAVGINNNNWIVGNYSDAAAGSSHGFLYDGTTWSTIDDPNAASGHTYVTGLNNLGQIVGYFIDSTSKVNTGFVYDASTHGFISVADPLATQGTMVNAINDKGVLAGTTGDGFGFTATLPAAVPLPASIWLLSPALAGLGLIGRRRIP